MTLKESKLNHLYKVKNISFCTPCDMTNNCMILSLMDRGLVPGSELTIISKKLGMYELKIDNTHIVIRKPDAELFDIEVE